MVNDIITAGGSITITGQHDDQSSFGVSLVIRMLRRHQGLYYELLMILAIIKVMLFLIMVLRLMAAAETFNLLVKILILVQVQP